MSIADTMSSWCRARLSTGGSRIEMGTDDRNCVTITKFLPLILAAEFEGGDSLAKEIQQSVKLRLAAHEYPRLIEFIDELPMTTTGKIRRVVLREREAT